jgi:2-amino-4-hydroxy-6-hydroxymethyldihydropteridine diphosphokinase
VHRGRGHARGAIQRQRGDGAGGKARAADPASGRGGLGRGLSLRDGYLGLGSNVGDRLTNLRDAARLIDSEQDVDVVGRSSVYVTEPVGEITDQPDFYNAALRIRTALEPLELLRTCKRVEERLGRTPGGPRHGPRPIDVDVLLIEGLTLDSEALRLPHPEVTSRRFVLIPLLELDPTLTLPDGIDLKRALAELAPGQRVERLASL